MECIVRPGPSVVWARNAAATCVSNDISGNQGDGISFSFVHGHLANNTIRKNPGTGILVDRSGGGTITGNKSWENAVGFWDVSPEGEGGQLAIYNNHFDNTENVEGFAPNTWEIAERPGPNIAGAPNLRGNYWALPNMKGFSRTHPDADRDGFCDLACEINGGFPAGVPTLITSRFGL